MVLPFPVDGHILFGQTRTNKPAALDCLHGKLIPRNDIGLNAVQFPGLKHIPASIADCLGHVAFAHLVLIQVVA